MVKIGVVGGAGFVGSHIAKHLTKKGFEVTVYDIKEPKDKTISFVRKDVVKDDLSDLGSNDFIIYTAIIQIPLINEKPLLGYMVNIKGLQKVLEVAQKSEKTKGVILTSTWHVYGERVKGVLSEDFGYHPDLVDDRARLYAYMKIMQESLIFSFNKIAPTKKFIAIRLGTVLGEGMPEKTAASIFIRNALSGKPITPYKHSMYRPMLYVSIDDVCEVVERIITSILEGAELKYTVFNVFYPEPITILELANLIKDAVIKLTEGKVEPKIEIVETGKDMQFDEDAVKNIRGDVKRLREALCISDLKSPKEIILDLVASYLKRSE